ncbi:unnamed protein product [marine sediment metagenome]|uniref:Adenylosuccinate lyase C-terminal domain-containing protein n=1 Tax=marine sediment metagenome TaxID=412755 RepID=X1EID9_9ZZZZ
MAKLAVDRASMKKSFDMSKDMIVAEPAHILLAAHGYPNAHEYITKLTLKSQKTGKPFTELLFQDKELKNYLRRFSENQLNILKNPEERYTGIAPQKVEDVCKYWESELKIEIESTGSVYKTGGRNG